MTFETLSQYKKERHHLLARLKVVDQKIKQLRDEKEQKEKEREERRLKAEYYKSLGLVQWQIEECLNGRR